MVIGGRCGFDVVSDIFWRCSVDGELKMWDERVLNAL